MSIFLFFITLIISLLLIWSIRFVRYQKKLFEWHCDNVYEFDKKLTEKELEYIHKCIYHSWWELFRPLFVLWDDMIFRLSFFSYSQKVSGEKVNKSRIAYGSVVRPNKAYEWAKVVINEKNIKLPFEPKDNFIFGGLGWDIDQQHFKVYYRYKNFNDLDDDLKKLQNEKDLNYSNQGILSWTFRDNVIVETKIYRYPINHLSAHLLSEKRKDIQTDCKENDDWKDNINTLGQEILIKYGENNIYLDTITIKDKDNFTLYFPQII